MFVARAPTSHRSPRKPSGIEIGLPARSVRRRESCHCRGRQRRARSATAAWSTWTRWWSVPRCGVVTAGQRAPRVTRAIIAVVPCEPQGHEPDRGDREDVGDLHGCHGQLRRRHEHERHAIRGAVEVLNAFRSVHSTHPQEHRAWNPAPFQRRPRRSPECWRQPFPASTFFRCPWRFVRKRRGCLQRSCATCLGCKRRPAFLRAPESSATSCSRASWTTRGSARAYVPMHSVAMVMPTMILFILLPRRFPQTVSLDPDYLDSGHSSLIASTVRSTSTCPPSGPMRLLWMTAL